MRIYVSYSYAEDQRLASGLIDALSVDGHDVFEPDLSSFEVAETMFTSITAAIRRSDLVIALLSTLNPNVYFEVGLAAGASVPTIVVASEPERLTFDLSSAPYVPLTGDDTIDIATIVRRVGEMGEAQRRPEPIISLGEVPILSTPAPDRVALEALSPLEMESLVAQLFRKRGIAVERPEGTDGGVDLILREPGTQDPQTIVQVKHYRRANLVSVGAVRELLDAMSYAGAERAILVSSSDFSRSARAFAADLPIDLLTIGDLVGMPASGSDAAPT